MDPIEDFYWLKQDIRILQDRAEALRDRFLQPGIRLRGNSYEVVVRRQSRRRFLIDRLPPEVLNDPQMWVETSVPVVSVRALEDQIRPQAGATIVMRP